MRLSARRRSAMATPPWRRPTATGVDLDPYTFVLLPHEGRGVLAPLEEGVPQDTPMEVSRRLRWRHEGLRHRPASPPDRLLARRPPDQHLRHERVVVGRHGVARIAVGVDADPGPPGMIHSRMGPGEGAKFLSGFRASMRARWRSPSTVRGCRHGCRSPAATSSCCFTKSTPVMSSVTGCSTWSRAFISMK